LISKYGIKLGEAEKVKIVYFALHQEPESALLSISPEFNNSMEIVAWVSKSLPADTILVIKENPWSFGIRSRKYYRNLMKIPNVHLAHPSVQSRDWIGRSTVVIAITGTVGFEAVYLGKPVVSFGKHQVINRLPTVRYSNNFFSTRKALEELLNLDPADKRFYLSRHALHKALQTVSFNLSGYDKTYKSSELHLDLAQVAANRLHQEYPDIFDR
jgi:lipid A disaccharide synthetase